MTAPKICVVSGGNGVSAEHLARTVAAQFPEQEIDIVVVPGVRRLADFESALADTARAGGIVIHTLADTSLQRELLNRCAEQDLPEFDLLGPPLGGISELLGVAPVGKPGMYRKLREDYFRRIEAIEFAVQHDDGRRIHELDRADIVLAGVSRAGKTPLSMYLGMLGYKTANVPLVKGLEAPSQLFEIDRRRVVGLHIEAERLAAFRRKRTHGMGAGDISGYTSAREVFEDTEHARLVFRKGHFPTLDVTNKPIEESAAEVIALTSGSV